LRQIAAASWLLLLVFLTGCMSTGQQSVNYGPQPVGDAQALPASSVATVSETFERASTVTPDSEDYRLGPLDVIEVSVFQVPELTKSVQINASGVISLPLIGTVRVGGRAIRDVEREIEQRLGEKYLQSPQVSILVKEYTSQRITVEGAVNSPGIYPISGRTTLLQAIALAKGPDRTADQSGVIIFRQTADAREAAVFDLGPIRAGEAPDPVLRGGDVIVVDQSAIRTAWRDIRESVGVLGFFRPFAF
jgi:polysaccharide biosynthesis/export protein